MKRRRVRNDRGFTLIELLFTVVIMGIITVPLGNFMLSYVDNYTTTQNRISDSHDIQIATAYFSQDVANFGLHQGSPNYGYSPSAWVPTSSTLPASYCGKSAGPLVLLLSWDVWTVGGNPPTGTDQPASVAYVKSANTLARVFCKTGTTTATNTTIVDNLQSATASCASPTQCDATTPSPPATISLTLSIATGSASSDQAAPTHAVVLTGQRRQT